MNLGQHLLVFLVRVYRYTLSPIKLALFGPFGRCRYTPSCSQYAIEAVQRHGVMGGVWLSTWRLCRCHPWGGCGHDPVPPGPRGDLFGDQDAHLAATANPAAEFSG